MLLQKAGGGDPAIRRFSATAFRDDGSATLVTISKLSFDRCRLESKKPFVVGERLRLHMPGQGFIVVDLVDLSEGFACAAFRTECQV